MLCWKTSFPSYLEQTHCNQCFTTNKTYYVTTVDNSWSQIIIRVLPTKYFCFLFPLAHCFHSEHQHCLVKKSHNKFVHDANSCVTNHKSSDPLLQVLDYTGEFYIIVSSVRQFVGKCLLLIERWWRELQRERCGHRCIAQQNCIYKLLTKKGGHTET